MTSRRAHRAAGDGRSSGYRRAALAIAAAAAVTATAACHPAPGPPRAPTRSPPLSLRIPALDGGTIAIAHYRGRVVVLHLFSTGDIATQLDAEKLSAAARQWPRRLVVIGIAFDTSGYPVVAPWRNAMHIPYLVGLATPALRSGRTPLGKIRRVPVTIVLDPEGRIVDRIDRPLRRGQLERLVRPLLSETTSAPATGN